jgi:predicted ATP-dependent endonuclease of OLD family
MPGQQSTAVSPQTETIVVVEGASDRAALLRLAHRRGRDLAAEGVDVIPIGGAHALRRFLSSLGERIGSVRLVGLCDAGEADDFRRALGEDRVCYVCDPDLEDELIRSLGAARIEQIIEADGRLRSFRTLQKQPDQRGRTPEQQLHVFLGNRKVSYAPLLVDALDLDNVPAPLDAILDYL